MPLQQKSDATCIYPVETEVYVMYLWPTGFAKQTNDICVQSGARDAQA